MQYKSEEHRLIWTGNVSGSVLKFAIFIYKWNTSQLTVIAIALCARHCCMAVHVLHNLMLFRLLWTGKQSVDCSPVISWLHLSRSLVLVTKVKSFHNQFMLKNFIDFMLMESSGRFYRHIMRYVSWIWYSTWIIDENVDIWIDAVSSVYK